MYVNLRWLCLLGLCLLRLGAAANAAPLTVGDAIPAFSAGDQNDRAFVSTNGEHFLLIATEMAPAKAANQTLAALGAGFLEKHSAAYVMDIHAMPALIRHFVVPKMRKYPQRIILVETAGILTAFPSQPDRVTVLTLTPSARIQKISYWDPAHDPATNCFN